MAWRVLERWNQACDADPTPLALLHLAGLLSHKVKSRILASMYGAPRIYLGPQSYIRGAKHIRFGRNIHIRSRVWLEAISRYGEQSFQPKIELGDDVALSDSVHISCISSIAIGRQTLIGSKVLITDHGHGSYLGETPSSPHQPPAQRPLTGGGPVWIGENVWIGDNVVILGPADIGAGCVIGANSVVRGVIPAGTIAVGAPASVRRIFDESSQQWKPHV